MHINSRKYPNTAKIGQWGPGSLANSSFLRASGGGFFTEQLRQKHVQYKREQLTNRIVGVAAMKKKRPDVISYAVLTAVILGLAAAMAMADGMIVPVRPEIRVRGHWAVKYHHVSIKVRDQVAAVHIDQEFVNTGRGMIEVEYLFPVPPGAAIDSMTMVVDGKEFTAKLLKADEARKIYEDIVRRKKDPALLEYVGFGLYRTKAFPLQPNKPCRVIVTYKNVCKKDRDLVEVWYPLNTEKFSAKPIDEVKVRVDIKSKADITAVYSPTHDLKVERKGPRHVIATYRQTKTLPVTDFLVYYKAANEKVGAMLLTHQPDAKKDGYFMLLVSPNPRTSKKSVVPKDIVLVLDCSGSMSGAKFEQATESLRYILKNLNSEDRFNVITYSDSVEAMFTGLVPASDGKVKEALDRIDRLEAAGATDMHGALMMTMKQFPVVMEAKVIPEAGGKRHILPPGKKPPRPAYAIFLTDGKPTAGKQDEAVIIKDTRKANAAGVRLFAFGVGYDVNVRLIDRLVGDNGGKSDYVKPKESVEGKITSLYTKIKNPVMTDIKLAVDGVRLRKMYPRQVGDLFDGDQIVLVGRYDAGEAAKLPSDLGTHRAQLVIKGLYAGRRKTFEYNVSLRPPGRDSRYCFVEKLWAMRRVGFLLDEIQLHGKSKEVIDEVIRLSRTYGIMTPYTSFLADETSVRPHKPGALRKRALEKTDSLASRISGGAGQLGAKNRQALNEAKQLPAASLDDSVVMTGHGKLADYEYGRRVVVKRVRQVGKDALYRRGRQWVAANAINIDPEKDKDKICVVKRYSEEYFKLVRANSVQENRIIATQKEKDELLIVLRGQAYLIK